MDSGRCTARRPCARPLAAAAALCVLAGCGSPSETPQADGGPVQGTDRLEPMDPLELGLKFGTSQVLRVVYMDADGNARPGRRVEFAIAGEARGSTLSTASALTDAGGIASVEVRAGQSLTTFAVHATSTNAGQVVYVVSVNERGEFAVLDVRASVPAELTVTGALDVMLYDQSLDGVTCATISPFAPPATARTKKADSPETAVNFGALEPSHDYTIMVLPDDDGVPEVGGCVDLLHDRLVAGTTELALVPLRRLHITAAAIYRVTSRLPVGSLSGVADAFAPLSCPLAPADVLIDCLVDARSTGPGDPLDCVPSTTADLDSDDGRELNLHRGAVQDGCRGEDIVPGVTSPSLEKYLHDELLSLAPTATAALGQAAAPNAVSQALAELTISSELHLEPTPSPEQWIALHVLRDATWTSTGGAAAFSVDLATVGLPRISAAGVPVTLSATSDFRIGAHELSLRFGHLTRRAAGALLFSPHGLPADSAGLVAVFTGALMSGHPSACDALDLLLCPAAGRAAGCLGPNCAEALAALPAALDARLYAFDGGADLALQGTARPSVSSGPEADFLAEGQWTVGLGPTASRTTLMATFSGTPMPAEQHLNRGTWTTPSP